MSPTSSEEHRRLEELDVDECLQLLDEVALGRLAFQRDSRIEVLPLNYRYWEGTVVIRTGWGSLLDAVHQRPVVFEIDDHDPEHKIGWSVVIRGRAEEMVDAAEIDRARAELGLVAWAPGRKDHLVRVLPASITGRRVKVAGS